MARLGLIAAAVLAFAQPFQASEQALAKKEMVIYLDDSFSMQARDNEGTLFEKATQSILRGVSRDQPFSLFTNNRTFRNVTIKEVQESLLELQPTPQQLSLDEIILKARGLFSSDSASDHELVLISDFQEQMVAEDITWPENVHVRAVPLEPEVTSNVSVDSLYISRSNPTSIEVTAILHSNGEVQDIPISLFDDTRLIAKASAGFNDRTESRVVYTLPRDEEINGRIELTDNSLTYDNSLFFNLGSQEAIKVMEIYNAPGSFLSRIYTGEEFDYRAVPLNALNYSDIEDQNLIILNELNTLPVSLQNTLRAFRREGGHIVLIPSSTIEIEGYNTFLAGEFNLRFTDQLTDSVTITGINFDHPLYRNVFEKRVENFQYPTTRVQYTMDRPVSRILSYSNNSGFLVGSPGAYLFTSPLSSETCNFSRSPLVVPTFYEMAKQSLALPDLYYPLGKRSVIDIAIPVDQDQIVKVARADYEFIPLQQSFAKKTRLSFLDNPVSDGIYTILVQEDSLKNISFNYPRTESKMVYKPPVESSSLTLLSSVDDLFLQLAEENRVKELWKWFVILALIFVLAEIGIQKFIK